MNNNFFDDKLKISSKIKTKINLLAFICLSVFILTINFKSFRSYEEIGLLSVMSIDSLLFVLIGMFMLGISSFTFEQMFNYKAGKFFSLYALLIGISISLAPCNRLDEPIITLIRDICTFGSSILLFQIIGYIALLTNDWFFKLFRLILITFTGAGIFAPIFISNPSSNIYINIIAFESKNIIIFLSSIFSLLSMLVKYRNSNSYTKKQSKVLIAGIAIGLTLFTVASILPSVYVVQNGKIGISHIELSMLPTETILSDFPLLLFSGVAVAIILMLIHRGFVFKNKKLKLSYFILIPSYLFCVNVLFFIFANCSFLIILILNILLVLPVLLLLQKTLKPVVGSDEEVYQWRLMEELEKEKQELSSYLHDEVLQSLIAFYRQLQADTSNQFIDMKTPLSDLISQIRNVSHNLYPTMVEDLGLEQSLFILVNELQEKFSPIKTSYHYNFKNGILPNSLSLSFYRIIRELAINSAKHSEGTQIEVILNEDNSGYYIQVNDNGKGFYMEDKELLESPHMGLYTVKKQVLKLQGVISLKSNQQTGTEYYIYFPKGGNNDEY